MKKENELQTGVIYYHNKWTKIIVLTLAVLFAVMAFVTRNVPLEFDWLFGSVKYWLGFVILAFVALIIFPFLFGEQRDGKVYLSEDGTFDLSTPREYVALKKPAFIRLLGRCGLQANKTLDFFAYNDGIVKLRTNKGNEIEAPLSELTWTYSIDNGSIYKYVLTDTQDREVVFYMNSAVLDDNEWDDIKMLLSQCGTVKESSQSKLYNRAAKVIEIVKDVDFSNVKDSIVRKNVDKASGTNKIIDSIWEKHYEKKPTSLWGKIKEWFWIILAILYVLFVVVINVENLMDYYSKQKQQNVDETEFVAVGDSNSQDEAENEYEAPSVASESTSDYADEGDAPMSGETVYVGKIDGKYEIRMTLALDDYSGWLYYTKYGPNNRLNLDIVDLTRGGAISIKETNDKGEQSGYYEGMLYGDTFEGTYTNYQGKEMSFKLTLVK